MAIIKKYEAEVTAIINHGEGVYTLEMHSLGREFKYTPGQFLHIALDEYDPSAGWPDSRCFSMQTSPESETLKITYAAKGNFTKNMASQLKVGSVVQLKMPYGDLFDKEHNLQASVFIAGGTGVTPFLSLFNDSRFSQYQNPVLYLGLRNENYNFYKTELDLAKTINPTLTVNLVLQDKAGVLNIADIQKAAPAGASFFISGPPAMIKAFKQHLLANGIAEHNVLTDDWE